MVVEVVQGMERLIGLLVNRFRWQERIGVKGEVEVGGVVWGWIEVKGRGGLGYRIGLGNDSIGHMKEDGMGG